MVNQTDLFRNLPDEIICKILTLLPTKLAVSTSVLSKRWRNLIAFVPKIDVDDSEKDKRKKDGMQQIFMDFVDRVLALQGNFPIESFSLKCGDGVDSDRVHRWIRNVIQRGVSEVRLSIVLGNEIYLLPREIFVSNTLVKLQIGSKIGFNDSHDLHIFFPVLKNLVLDSVKFTVSQLNRLLSACPVLEELNIKHIVWDSTNVTVSSESLKKLVILAYGVINFLYLQSISFNAPNVVSLSYSDFLAEDYPQVNFTNLVDAIINLSLTCGQFKQVRGAPNTYLFGNNLDEEHVFPQFANVWKLFNGIRMVQKLFLGPDTLEVLSLCGESMPVFNNLKIMRIKSDPDRGWQAMPNLLTNSPHLETLIFEGLLHYQTDKCGDACDCISREEKGLSLLSCPVKFIEIKAFTGTDKEIQMIKHFLEYFKCLKKMEIYLAEDGCTKLEDPLLFHNCTMEMIDMYSKFSTCDVRLHFGRNTSISPMVAYNRTR